MNMEGPCSGSSLGTALCTHSSHKPLKAKLMTAGDFYVRHACLRGRRWFLLCAAICVVCAALSLSPVLLQTSMDCERPYVGRGRDLMQSSALFDGLRHAARANSGGQRMVLGAATCVHRGCWGP